MVDTSQTINSVKYAKYMDKRQCTNYYSWNFYFFLLSITLCPAFSRKKISKQFTSLQRVLHAPLTSQPPTSLGKSSEVLRRVGGDQSFRRFETLQCFHVCCRALPEDEGITRLRNYGKYGLQQHGVTYQKNLNISNLLTYSRTPWSRVLLEQLTVPHLVN